MERNLVASGDADKQTNIVWQNVTRFTKSNGTRGLA